MEKGWCEPVCTNDPDIAGHALCQAAAEFDVAIETDNKELADLAKYYGVRVIHKRSRHG